MRCFIYREMLYLTLIQPPSLTFQRFIKLLKNRDFKHRHAPMTPRMLRQPSAAINSVVLFSSSASTLYLSVSESSKRLKVSAARSAASAIFL